MAKAKAGKRAPLTAEEAEGAVILTLGDASVFSEEAVALVAAGSADPEYMVDRKGRLKRIRREGGKKKDRVGKVEGCAVRVDLGAPAALSLQSDWSPAEQTPREEPVKRQRSARGSDSSPIAVPAAPHSGLSLADELLLELGE